MVLFVSATLLMMSYLFVFRTDLEFWRFPAQLEQIFPDIEWAAPMLFGFCFLLLFYLFPDGRFTPAWLRWAPVALVLLFIILLYTTDLLPEDIAWSLVLTLIASLFIAGIASQVYRQAHANHLQRQQSRLTVAALVIFTFLPVIQFLLTDLFSFRFDTWIYFISLHVILIVAALIPLTIGISVLRYRLWEVDALVNRTLVYGALTAAVLLLYGLGVGLAGAVLPAEAQWFIPALALVIAVLIVWPAHGRVQHWADRLLPVEGGTVRDSSLSSSAPGAARDVAWSMRVLQGIWVLLLVGLAWQILQRLLEVGALVNDMQGEWLVQESLRALPDVDPAGFARLLVFGGLWTLGISWLLAGYIFRRKRDDGMALYVAYMLLIIPFGIGPGTHPTPLIEALSFLGIAMGILFLFIFPDGRFVPQTQRWRGALVALFLLTPPLGYAISRLLNPGEGPEDWGYGAFIFTIAAVMLAGATGQLYRYRYLSDTVQRRQTRWVLLALVLQALFFLWAALWIGGIPGRLGIPESLLALTTLGIIFIANAALPLSLAVAVLVDRLWQMDLVLNRTLVFGGLTALVVLLYVLVVGVLGRLFQSGSSLLLSILATGLIAVLFNPLRQRLQQGVNRLMYGDRDDPLAVLSKLGQQLENMAVPAETLPALVKTIAETLKLPYVAIETLSDAGGRQLVAVSAADGQRPLKTLAFPLAYQGAAVGDLLVAPRAAGETFTAEEERLLRNVARQAGTAVYAYQITNQLRRSRARLVTAREEERLRLRRDLHDGLGPQLATLNVKIDAAQNLLAGDPQAAEGLLAEVKRESQEAIAEIRRVVDGLRPSALDQLGLLSALQEFVIQQETTSSAAITLDVGADFPALPAAVEVATYRIISEAVTNVMKHAGAQTCAIKLRIADCASPVGGASGSHQPPAPNQLCIEIVDDGSGLPPSYVPGVGLASMRERAQELGGTFAITSEPGSGTAVRVTLPFTSRQEPS